MVWCLKMIKRLFLAISHSYIITEEWIENRAGQMFNMDL